MLMNISKNFLAYHAAVTFYFTCVALLYQIGFWGVFRVNPLRYANLAYLIGLSVQPVIIALILIPLEAAVVHFSFGRRYRDRAAGAVLRQMAIGMSYVVVTSIVFGATDLLLVSIWIFPAFLATFILRKHRFLSTLITDEFANGLFVFGICYLPLLALGMGFVGGRKAANDKLSTVEYAELPAPLQSLLAKGTCSILECWEIMCFCIMAAS